MGGRLILFGATGYTGRLVARAMLERGLRPVLAARSLARLEALRENLSADCDIAAADVSRPDSLRRLPSPGDVLVSTVGPFARWGDTAAQAAVDSGAQYLDSNGEPPFTRRVFEHYGPAACRAGIVMLPAFGWECVLGNLAGALALSEAGESAVRVDTGYFYVGSVGFSAGTRASFASAVARPSFAYRDGRLAAVRGAERHRTIRVGGETRHAVSLGASEHYALPRSYPQLREVNAYLGWLGGVPERLARPLSVMSRPAFAVVNRPAARAMYDALTRRVLRGSRGGPSSAERKGAGVRVVGITYNARGTQLSEVQLGGAEGYDFTAAILAWAAGRVAVDPPRSRGAVGPVEAFGIDQLEAGCREAGVRRI